MRAIAGAIIVLAGAVLVATSLAVIEFVPIVGPRHAGVVATAAALGGAALVVFGVAVVAVETRRNRGSDPG